MLVTTGLHDSQVQYWEPAKWVAKLRELKTDDNLLLLCTDMDSGHGGKSGRFKSYEGWRWSTPFSSPWRRGHCREKRQCRRYSRGNA